MVMKKNVVTRKCVNGLGILGLLCASAAANADVTSTDIYVQQNFFQTDGTTVVDLMSSPFAALSTSLGAAGPGGNVKVSFQVGVATAADFTSITVAGPGFGSSQLLGAPTLDNGVYKASYVDYDFSSVAAMNAKYPLGSTYQFTETASNPALSQSTTVTYGANHQPTTTAGGTVVAVPELTAASYASLQGLHVTSADTLAFNAPFYGDGSTRLELEIINATTLASVYQSAYQPSTTTSLLLGANTLTASTQYLYALGYENTDVSGCAASGSSCELLDFENYTFGEFTTAATTGVSVPEPATLALLCLGLAGVGFTRKRNSSRASRSTR